MASKETTVNFILEQLASLGTVRAKKMFGEYALFCHDKTVALICDDQLFVKPTEAGENFMGKIVEGFPYPGAKPWFLISRNQWENRTWLCQLIEITSAALPMPKKKPPSRKKKRVGKVKS